jgi:hypothetical protein
VDQFKGGGSVANAGILGVAIIIHSLDADPFFIQRRVNEKRFGTVNLAEVLYAVFWNHIATPIIGREATQHLTGLPFGLSALLLVSFALAASAGIYVYRLRIQFWCNNWLIGYVFQGARRSQVLITTPEDGMVFCRDGCYSSFCSTCRGILI